jgi:WD40 repeat protein
VSEQALLSFIHSEDETLLWRVDGPDDPIPIDASDHQAAKPGSYQSLNFPHGYDRMWLAVDGLCALGLAHAHWQSRQSFSLWVADGDPRHRFAKFDGVVTDAYDGGPHLAVTVTGGRRVHLWNFDRAGGPQELVNDEAADVTKAWFSAEGGRVFVATMRGKLWVTRTDSVQRPLLLEGHSAPVRSAVVAPDGRWMLTTGEDKVGIRWSLEGAGRLVARRDLGQCYLDLVLSPDASRVAGWIESNQWQRGLPDVGVWNTSLDSSPLLVRPGATESDDSRASQSKAFDDSGDRLILRKGGTTQTWPITWRSLQDRLWELEPTNPSLDERQALLGYLPVVREYPKE